MLIRGCFYYCWEPWFFNRLIIGSLFYFMTKYIQFLLKIIYTGILVWLDMTYPRVYLIYSFDLLKPLVLIIYTTFGKVGFYYQRGCCQRSSILGAVYIFFRTTHQYIYFLLTLVGITVIYCPVTTQEGIQTNVLGLV